MLNEEEFDVVTTHVFHQGTPSKKGKHDDASSTRMHVFDEDGNSLSYMMVQETGAIYTGANRDDTPRQ